MKLMTRSLIVLVSHGSWSSGGVGCSRHSRIALTFGEKVASSSAHGVDKTQCALATEEATALHYYAISYLAPTVTVGSHDEVTSWGISEGAVDMWLQQNNARCYQVRNDGRSTQEWILMDKWNIELSWDDVRCSHRLTSLPLRRLVTLGTSFSFVKVGDIGAGSIFSCFIVVLLCGPTLMWWLRRTSCGSPSCCSGVGTRLKH